MKSDNLSTSAVCIFVQIIWLFQEVQDSLTFMHTDQFFSATCRYSPKNPTLVSETVHYKRGVSQQFSMPSFKIDFSEWKEEDVSIRSSQWTQTHVVSTGVCQ